MIVREIGDRRVEGQRCWATSAMPMRTWVTHSRPSNFMNSSWPSAARPVTGVGKRAMRCGNPRWRARFIEQSRRGRHCAGGGGAGDFHEAIEDLDAPMVRATLAKWRGQA